LCLHFAHLFVAWLGLSRHGLAKIVLLLASANILFAAILAIALSTRGNLLNNALLSVRVAATNLLPVLVVAPVAWIVHPITRSRQA
jgi:hypothetical protein